MFIASGSGGWGAPSELPDAFAQAIRTAGTHDRMNRAGHPYLMALLPFSRGLVQFCTATGVTPRPVGPQPRRRAPGTKSERYALSTWTPPLMAVARAKRLPERAGNVKRIGRLNHAIREPTRTTSCVLKTTCVFRKRTKGPLDRLSRLDPSRLHERRLWIYHRGETVATGSLSSVAVEF